MSDTLRDFLSEYDKSVFATERGTEMHDKMQTIHTENGKLCGDDEIVENIKKHPEFKQFFGENSRAEVPVAAEINGRFISRRIDRLVVDVAHKIIHIIDYKTDINKDLFRQKYVSQVREYVAIINKIYPKYTVYGYILWLQDWTLENV
jgi:ATP-dependent exoDNAse (exonuclease V) beta subunit